MKEGCLRRMKDEERKENERKEGRKEKTNELNE